MSVFKSSKPFSTDEDDYDTVLKSDVTFRGAITISKPLMIKGKVSGTIDAAEDLLIDTGAEINADISANRVMVLGKITGNVTGKSFVQVASSGSVLGDITAPHLVLEGGEGASEGARCWTAHLKAEP